MSSRRLVMLTMCTGVVLVQAACSFTVSGGGGVKGSGVVQIETRPVSGFTQIKLVGSGDVIIKQTGRESLTVRAEDNILPLLETYVSDRVLSLGSAKSSFSTTKGIQYLVEVKDLEGVSILGSGNIKAEEVQCGTTAVSIGGSGNVTISGIADVLDVSVSGSGNFEGQDFRAGQATVAVSGSGNAVVNAADQLDAHVSGSGSIEYIGTPEVHTSVSGSGSVREY